MKSWVLAAGLLAAAAVSPALAADMDDGKTPYPKGGVYDDPRYPPKGPPPGYEDDDDDGPNTPPNKFSGPPPDKYAAPPPRYAPPPKYSAAPPPPYAGKCVRSEEVRDRLTNLGWRDFHAGQPVNETTVTLRARRPSGRLFELTLHRCSGQIVDARPLEPRPYGNGYADRGPDGPGYGSPYAYYGRPWFDGPYAYRWSRRWNRDY
jgi:hypothetical protein